MVTRQHRALSQAGFTLLEISAAILVIGILTALALPAYYKMRQKSSNLLVINELRSASGALTFYVTEKGSWPPDGKGGWPSEMTGYLPPPDRWTQPTPIGGTWAWTLNSDETAASIRINDYTATMAQVLDLDRMIDDGNLTSGNVLSSGHSLVYVMER